jgi:hypothetical protein
MFAMPWSTIFRDEISGDVDFRVKIYPEAKMISFENSNSSKPFFSIQVAPMTSVAARRTGSGGGKMFQDIFLNQGAEQLCLPAQARYRL